MPELKEVIERLEKAEGRWSFKVFDADGDEFASGEAGCAADAMREASHYAMMAGGNAMWTLKPLLEKNDG